jgi:hypothetical protein
MMNKVSWPHFREVTMAHVELPRPLADYFAFAELERRGETRRFTITLPYLAGDELGRLQWWWRVSVTEEALIGEAGMEARRAREIERFSRHVERWLANTHQSLAGDGPIPRISVLPAPQAPEPAEEPVASDERRYA